MNEHHEPGANVRATKEIAFAHGVSVADGTPGRVQSKITSSSESTGVDDTAGYLVEFENMAEAVFATDDDLEAG